VLLGVLLAVGGRVGVGVLLGSGVLVEPGVKLGVIVIAVGVMDPV